MNFKQIRGFHFCHLNVYSLLRRFDVFKQHVLNSPPCQTETLVVSLESFSQTLQSLFGPYLHGQLAFRIVLLSVDDDWWTYYYIDHRPTSRLHRPITLVYML